MDQTLIKMRMWGAPVLGEEIVITIAMVILQGVNFVIAGSRPTPLLRASSNYSTSQKNE
jgi:hypothetical protein